MKLFLRADSGHEIVVAEYVEDWNWDADEVLRTMFCRLNKALDAAARLDVAADCASVPTRHRWQQIQQERLKGER